MPIYHDYAPFYDGSGQIRFAVLMGQYLREALVIHPVAGRRALDLACGTGTLACLLADDGWEVVGVDRSAPMLAIARERAAQADSPGRLTFAQGDMRNFNDERGTMNDDEISGPHASSFIVHRSSFDLVTCTYDSLNYLLTEQDLARCFGGAARALRPGGLFFADMNTRYFLEHDWGECEVLEQPGFVQIAQSSFDPATACSTMALTGFAGRDERGYRRFDETHVERAYAPEVVARLLASAGLCVEAAYDCFTFQPAYERSQRIAWVARRETMNDER
jgi:SAM-dependent methyltransferase